MFRSALFNARSSTRSASTLSKAGPSAQSYIIGAGLVGLTAVSILSYNTKSAEWFSQSKKASQKTLTDPNEWVSLPLMSSQQVNHNTKTLKFALPTEDHIIGLNVASALLTKFQGPNDEKPTIRPYTPISDENTKGYVELMVKKYPGGPMSSHVCEMEKNQRLLFKGPIEKYKYEANSFDTIGLIAAGTGITPMYQLIRAVMNNPDDKTKIVLVTANISEEDILLKHEFERLEQEHPLQFRAFYVLEKAPKDWPGQGGRISKDLLETIFPRPSDQKFKAFICGPPGFYAAVSGTKKSPKDQGDLGGFLSELGYNKDQVYKF